MEKRITRGYLKCYPNHIFVFGDNLARKGFGGAATLRDCRNTYGFITKKRPNSEKSSFYKADEYVYIYQREMIKLKKEIRRYPNNTYLISKLGAGLANKYHIWEKVIYPNIKHDLSIFTNIVFLWE